MLTQPYQLPKKEYGLWYEVNEYLGWSAAAALAQVLYKEPGERNFDMPELAFWLPRIRPMAERRGVALS